VAARSSTRSPITRSWSIIIGAMPGDEDGRIKSVRTSSAGKQ
jgi:hypothetical protein